jgi:hypothetical protein
LAGTALALATIKVATMLPFLLLFLRRGDRWTWASMAAVVLGLCLLGSPVQDLPRRMREEVQNIARYRMPGELDDYSFQSPVHHCIVAVNRWLYCLGLRDRTLIQVLQLVLLLAIAGWLGWEFYGRSAAPPGAQLPTAACEAMVCLLASIFLYHRLYDMVVLALPLLYCVEQSRTRTGWRRWGFALCVIGILAVLNLPRGKPLSDLANWSHGAGTLGWAVQAIVLPYSVWVVFFVMAMIKFGSRAERLPAAPQAIGVDKG